MGRNILVIVVFGLSLILATSQTATAQEPANQEPAFARFITPQTMLFAHYRFGELMKLPITQAMIAKVPGGKEQMNRDFQKGLGISVDDVESATLLMDELVVRDGAPEPSGPPYILMLAKRDLDFAVVRATLGAEAKTVPLGKHELSANAMQALIRIDSRTVLSFPNTGGASIDVMQKKLSSLFGDNKSDRETVERFQFSLDQVKDSKNLFVVGFSVPWNLRRFLDEQLAGAPPAMTPLKALTKMQSGYLTMQALAGQSEDLRFRLVGSFPDARSAQAGLGSVRFAIGTGKIALNNLPKKEAPQNLENFWLFAANYARKQVEKIKTEQKEKDVNVTYDLNGQEFLPVVTLATEKVRLAANKMVSANNMRQLMIAMHNYHTDHAHMPEAMTLKDGKPLHSWRVLILPYLEQQDLYNQLSLNEPWDSPHNRKVFESHPMPKIFENPHFPDDGKKLTNYQVFYSRTNEKKAAAFRLGTKVTLGQITLHDGTSNTIAMAENPNGVLWYKPEDVEFDVKKPFPIRKGMWPHNIVQVAFFDASVRNLLLGKDEDIAKALVTWDGEEQVDANKVIE